MQGAEAGVAGLPLPGWGGRAHAHSEPSGKLGSSRGPQRPRPRPARCTWPELPPLTPPSLRILALQQSPVTGAIVGPPHDPRGPASEFHCVGTGAPAWGTEVRAQTCRSRQTQTRAPLPGRPTCTRRPAGCGNAGRGRGLPAGEAGAAGRGGRALGRSLGPTPASPATSGKPPDLECVVVVLLLPRLRGCSSRAWHLPGVPRVRRPCCPPSSAQRSRARPALPTSEPPEPALAPTWSSPHSRAPRPWPWRLWCSPVGGRSTCRGRASRPLVLLLQACWGAGGWPWPRLHPARPPVLPQTSRVGRLGERRL